MASIDILEQSIKDISHELLELLLVDKTTKGYIRWGTNQYYRHGVDYRAEKEIFPDLIVGKHSKIIMPRSAKSEKEQLKRTKDKAEVFTAAWICNEQNNLIDEAWFGRKDVFNSQAEDHIWITNREPVIFPNGRTWKEYVDANRLEVSCGEAPYLVSLYDASNGVSISIEDRIGLLDRKLRIVAENTSTEEEWYDWTIRAFQSVYGYDYQGDNVLLARENLIRTFIEYKYHKFKKKPDIKQIMKIANIVAWNIWQMDGIKMTAPYSEMEEEFVQLSLFPEEQSEKREIPCRIFDWRSNRSIEFRSLIKG